MMSRSVMMPSSVSPSITSSDPVCCAHIAAAAVLIDSDGDSVMLALVMTSLTYIGGSFASHDTLQTSQTTRVRLALSAEPHSQRRRTGEAKRRHERGAEPRPMTTTAHAPVTPPGSTSLGEEVIPAQRSRLERLVRGRPGDPSWARPALLGLLGLTALLYLWNLGASGNANDFYAAAVQAGTKSWKAMFFGSLDAGNAITVDKPAAFLWPMEISGRI